MLGRIIISGAFLAVALWGAALEGQVCQGGRCFRALAPRAGRVALAVPAGRPAIAAATSAPKAFVMAQPIVPAFNVASAGPTVASASPATRVTPYRRGLFRRPIRSWTPVVVETVDVSTIEPTKPAPADNHGAGADNTEVEPPAPVPSLSPDDALRADSVARHLPNLRVF